MGMTPDDVKSRVTSAYNQASDSYDHRFNTFWDRFGRKTVERLRVPPGSRVLDVCCGSGASAIPAAEVVGESGHVLAVDLSEDLIRLGQAKASRLGLGHIHFRVADMLELDLQPQSFDYVICVFGVFFVPDMAAALQEMWRFVRSGGRLAVTVWGKGLFEPLNSMFWNAIAQTHPPLYKAFNPWDRIGEPSAVVQLFNEAGLQTPHVAIEHATHDISEQGSAAALLMGTGYRGVLAQLSPDERVSLLDGISQRVRAERVTEVKTDVIYATCQKGDARNATA